MTTSSISLNPLKLSACIDEYDDGIDDSIKLSVLNDKFSSLAILNINGRTLSSFPEETLLRLRSLLANKPISVCKLDMGYDNAPDEKAIEKHLSMASFFKARMVCVGIDKRAFRDSILLKLFLDRLTDRSVAMSIIPLLDISSESFFTNPDDLIDFMSPYKRIKLLYDPCRFMEKSRSFPYEKWWSKINKFVGAVIARDFKTGFGFFPVGLGQTRVADSIIEYINNGGLNIIFKPSLGRRYGSIIGRKATFELALSTLIEKMGGRI